jgi:hypothetical protein
MALLALSVVMFAVFVALVVRGVRAARRGIERARREVRRTVSDAALSARSAQPGVMGELARTRRELRASVESARGALTGGDPALGEAMALFRQLDGHFRHVDGELGTLMTGEPDRARVAARLPELRQRAERIGRSADALRFAAQDRARRHDEEGLEALHRQIDLEAEALRHWAPVDGLGAAHEPDRTVEPPDSAARRRILGRRRRDTQRDES